MHIFRLLWLELERERVWIYRLVSVCFVRFWIENCILNGKSCKRRSNIKQCIAIAINWNGIVMKNQKKKYEERKADHIHAQSCHRNDALLCENNSKKPEKRKKIRSVNSKFISKRIFFVRSCRAHFHSRDSKWLLAKHMCIFITQSLHI